jgi:hypothetical protein
MQANLRYKCVSMTREFVDMNLTIDKILILKSSYRYLIKLYKSTNDISSIRFPSKIHRANSRSHLSEGLDRKKS